jgi:hypothetical protein
MPNALPGNLRQALIEHFSLEELRTLCFDLGVNYDQLGGESIDGKARELLLHLRRDGRLSDLCPLLQQLRPHVAWAELVAASEAGAARSIGDGLEALTSLVHAPAVRAAVIVFRTQFQSASAQIEVLADYKDLHDLLHTLQFLCYSTMAKEAPRFPADESAESNLLDYELTFQHLVSQIQDVSARPSMPTGEALWVSDLHQAQGRLREGLERRDAAALQQSLWLIRRVLDRYPSRINERLNAAGRALRLDAIEQAMTAICDELASLQLTGDAVEQCQAGAIALAALQRDLATLAAEHDQWQAIDVELRRIEAVVGSDTAELEASWPYLKALSEPLCAGRAVSWIQSLSEATAGLDAAIAAHDPSQTRRQFARYRRLAGACFYQADKQLKELCDDLRKIGEPLSSLLRVLA